MSIWTGFDVTLAREPLLAMLQNLSLIGIEKQVIPAAQYTRIIVAPNEVTMTAVDGVIAVRATLPCNTTRSGEASFHTLKLTQWLTVVHGDVVRLRSNSIDHPHPNAPLPVAKEVGLFDEPDEAAPPPAPITQWTPITSLQCGKSESTVNGYDLDNMMVIPSTGVDETTIAVDDQQLLRALEAVTWLIPTHRSASENEARLQLHLAENVLRVQATNGYAAAEATVDVQASATDAHWTCAIPGREAQKIENLVRQNVRRATVGQKQPVEPRLLTITITDTGRIVIRSDRLLIVTLQSGGKSPSLDPFFKDLTVVQQVMFEQKVLHHGLMLMRAFQQKTGNVLISCDEPPNDAPRIADVVLRTYQPEVANVATTIPALWTSGEGQILKQFNNTGLIRMVTHLNGEKIFFSVVQTAKGQQILRIDNDVERITYVLAPIGTDKEAVAFLGWATHEFQAKYHTAAQTEMTDETESASEADDIEETDETDEGEEEDER